MSPAKAHTLGEVYHHLIIMYSLCTHFTSKDQTHTQNSSRQSFQTSCPSIKVSNCLTWVTTVVSLGSCVAADVPEQRGHTEVMLYGELRWCPMWCCPEEAAATTILSHSLQAVPSGRQINKVGQVSGYFIEGASSPSGESRPTSKYPHHTRP